MSDMYLVFDMLHQLVVIRPTRPFR